MWYIYSSSAPGTKLIINGTLNNGANASINNSGTININGLCNYTSGYWHSGSNSFIYGSSGTLAYVGSALTTTNNEWPITNSPGNVKINSTGNITLNSSKTIIGAFTLTNGILIITDNTLTLNGPVSYTSGTLTGGSTSNIEIGDAGSAANASLPPVSGGLQNLTINRAKGMTLGGALTVSTTLTMTLGNITTGSNLLTLGTSTTVRGTLIYNSGTIITRSTGGFKRWFRNAIQQNVYFPVGTNDNIYLTTYNNMITLSFTGAPTEGGSLTAKFVASDPQTNSPNPVNDAGYSIDRFSQHGYWQMDAGDGLTGGTYNLYLRGQGFNPNGNEITNFPHLRILKRVNSGSNWILKGSHVDATQFSNSDPIISRNGITGFGQFGIGGNLLDGNPLSGALPVELASFTANIISRNVKLNWTTASEENNEGFEIQKAEVKSQKSDEWIMVGYVNGNGTKTTPTNYTFEDKKLNSGKYNYRLKQIDYNGNFEYFNLSSAVVIGVPDKFDISQNYPNPFNPSTKIDFNLHYSSRVSIKLYDMSGREVMTLVNEQKSAGYYTVQMNGSNLSSGTYFYRVIADGNGQKYEITKKLVLIK